jgi:exopolysaccharide biosynthesis polyprenyl glycosylphosphotransferase
VLTRPQHTRTRFLQLADGLLFVLAVALAYGLRSAFPLLDLPDLETFDDYLWLLMLMGITGPLILAQQGFYRPASPQSRGAAIFTIIQSCAYAVLAMVLFLFIVRVQFARSVIILGGGFAGLLVYARHEFSRKFADAKIAVSEMRRRVLWVGPPPVVTRLQANLTPVENEILIHSATLDPGTADLAIDLPRSLHTHAINLVVLSLPNLPESASTLVIEACEREGVELVLHPGLPVASPFRLTVDQIGGEPVLYYRAHGAQPADLMIKQIADYLGAAFLLLALSPLLLLLAFLVRLSSPGPAIYRQQRAGLNGQPFTMYKFRSMSVVADKLKPALAAQNEMDGPVFKIANDPRVTRLGRILRRHSLDELPQLWNVLRGEMSLVGPRPLPVEEVHRFDNFAHRRRLSMKPGLTCLWQIRGRNEITSFEEWVRLDLEYIDQWSLWLDLKILLATIPVTLFGRGGR